MEKEVLKAAILSFLIVAVNLFAQETSLRFNTEPDTLNEYGYVEAINYSPVFTIEAWIKLDSALAGDQTFLSAHHIQMKRTSDGHIEIYDHGNGVTAGISTSTLGEKKWMHIAYTQTAESGPAVGTLYINGIKESEVYSVGGYMYGLIVGNNSSYTDEDRWIGSIDEVRVWTDVRTAEEILNNKDKELEGSEEGLIAYYKFNEASGKIARNSAGTNNLTLNNMEETDWTDGVFFSGGIPVADAGEDQIVTDSDGSGDEEVTLDGSASKDKDGTIVNYSWSENGTEIASGVNPTVVLAVGEHTITLTVTDDSSNANEDDVSIYVLSSATNRSIELNNGTLDELFVAGGFDTFQASWSLECWVKFRTFKEEGVDELHLLEISQGGINDATQWYVQTIDPVTQEAKNVLSSNGSGSAFGGVGKTELDTAKWYHIALSVDGVNKTFTWYINGEEDYSGSSITANGHPNMMPFVTIGHFRDFEYDANWSAATAKFDDIRVWYKAITKDEIKSNMYKTLINADDLEASWTFDVADFTRDFTGHGHTLDSDGRVDVTNLSDDVPFVTDIGEKSVIYPTEYALSQNYPNPFNPVTTINYSLPKASNVKIDIYNTLGQKIAQLVKSKQSAGKYSVTWHAGNLASGIYIYRFEADGFVQTKKMLLLK